MPSKQTKSAKTEPAGTRGDREGETALDSDRRERPPSTSTEDRDGEQASAQENSPPSGTEQGDSPTDEADSPIAAEVENSREELAALELRAKIADDRLMRTLADIENVRKRAARDVENAHKFGIESLAKSLLAVVDNFDRALVFLQDETVDGALSDAIVEGVQLTRKSLLDALRSGGIEEMSPLNAEFDPGRHRAMTMVPNSGKPAGSVVEVLRKGYMLHDRLLREAEVVVAAPEPASEPEASA